MRKTAVYTRTVNDIADELVEIGAPIPEKFAEHGISLFENCFDCIWLENYRRFLNRQEVENEL